MTRVRVSADIPLKPRAAFEAFLDELELALAVAGLRLYPGAEGSVVEGDVEVGRVVVWDPGVRVLLLWRPAPWAPDTETEVELRFEPAGGGTRITVEHRGWARALGNDAVELNGWFASAVAAPFVAAAAPAGFGDWVTDRGARRPAGSQARGVYRDPLYHRPNFRVLLDLLAPTAEDVLLEVGCGGGAFLEEALRSGCRASAVDHSPDMVRLARETNAAALAEGRLEVVRASADLLPFDDRTFTCGVMTGVFGFLPDPVAALRELRRVLRPGGRAAVLGSDPALRGTPAAPEPFASRLQFYDDETHEQLAGAAGFAEVRVERHDMEHYAREVGVPEEHVPLFAGPGGPFLVLRA